MIITIHICRCGSFDAGTEDAGSIFDAESILCFYKACRTEAFARCVLTISKRILDTKAASIYLTTKDSRSFGNFDKTSAGPSVITMLSECLKLANPGMYIPGSQEKIIPGFKGLVLKAIS